MITVLHEQRETDLPDAVAERDRLWLNGQEIERATGWAWKPEGLCRDEICLPVAPSMRTELVKDGRLDLAAMWRRSGQPVVHDAASRTWVLGTGAEQRSAALASLEAPDFALPDLHGQAHRLSSFRGRKVFLVTWASW